MIDITLVSTTCINNPQIKKTGSNEPVFYILT